MKSTITFVLFGLISFLQGFSQNAVKSSFRYTAGFGAWPKEGMLFHKYKILRSYASTLGNSLITSLITASPCQIYSNQYSFTSAGDSSDKKLFRTIAAGEKISGFGLPQILSETPRAEIDETNLLVISSWVLKNVDGLRQNL